MAHTVEPCVFKIAQTRINENAMCHWLSYLGVSEEAQHNLLSSTKTNAERLIEAAGRRCYLSFQPGLNPNVQRIRQDIAAYITNLLDKRDGSVLEHATYTFAIEGVSRVFTAEMNRHRAGTAISEGSLRYIRFDDIPYWIPTSIRKDETPMPPNRRIRGFCDYDTKEEAARASLKRMFDCAEREYEVQCQIWKEELAADSTFKKKKDITSLLRRGIPMGVATGGIWTGNVRALRHICEMRCSGFAEEEICLVAGAMLRLLIEDEPNLFGDFSFDSHGLVAKPKYSKV